MKLLFRLALAIGISGGALSAANILLNPGFESPAIASNGFVVLPTGSTFITNWTVGGGPACSGNCVLLLGTAYTEPGISFPAHSGNAALDMTGSGNTVVGTISQTVNLTVGEEYELSFWLGNQFNSFPNYTLPSSLDVLVNGTLLATATNNNNTPYTVNWQQYSMKFTAAVVPNTITFRNATGAGDSMAGLDDVYLDLVPQPVPEPATMALMGGSLLALGLTRSRRRRS